jgi:hypothetical protein
MLDIDRATQDGAEGVTLGLIGRHRPWRLIRRLQPRYTERADWLVEDADSGDRLVLEISGTDRGAMEPRLREKTAQAKLSPAARLAAACVVRFLAPSAALWNQDGPS